MTSYRRASRWDEAYRGLGGLVYRGKWKDKSIDFSDSAQARMGYHGT